MTPKRRRGLRRAAAQAARHAFHLRTRRAHVRRLDCPRCQLPFLGGSSARCACKVSWPAWDVLRKETT